VTTGIATFESPSDNENRAGAWVAAFAAAWRAPKDAEDFIGRIQPWLAPDYRFNQPIGGRSCVGHEAFDSRFAVPLFALLSNIRGTVESWTFRNNTVLIELVVNATVGRRPITLLVCDRVILRNGLAVERFTYTDPLPLVLAILRTPSRWAPAMRWLAHEATATNEPAPPPSPEPPPQATLTAGTVHYRDIGDGPPIVFLHGLLTNGSLWNTVAADLQPAYRCISPDWPLGAHSTPMRPDADLSPRGVAAIVAEFLRELELTDVTLVANDTGGAIAQLVAVNHPDRVDRLVLTSSDAFDNFLPPMFRPLQYAARIPGLINLLLQGLRLRRLRRLPPAYGWLAKRPIPDHIIDGWLAPAQHNHAIRRDIERFLRAIDTAVTLDAAEHLAAFDKPVLLAWATEDRFFPTEHARQLATRFPNAQVVFVDDSYTFIAQDQPARLADLIGTFAADNNTAPERS